MSFPLSRSCELPHPSSHNDTVDRGVHSGLGVNPRFPRGLWLVVALLAVGLLLADAALLASGQRQQQLEQFLVVRAQLQSHLAKQRQVIEALAASAERDASIVQPPASKLTASPWPARLAWAAQHVTPAALPSGQIGWVDGADQQGVVVAGDGAGQQPHVAMVAPAAALLARHGRAPTQSRLLTTGVVDSPNDGYLLVHRRQLCCDVEAGSLVVVEALHPVLQRLVGTDLAFNLVAEDAPAPTWLADDEARNALAVPGRVLIRWQGSQLWLAARVPETGALLLVSRPWHAVWRDDAPRVLQSLLPVAALLAALTLLLLVIDRRLLAPARLRSTQLHESEALSRSLLHLTPVGLCLLDFGQVRPVMQNALAVRYAAAAQRAGVALHEAVMSGYQARRTTTDAGEEEIEFELSHPSADGTGTCHLHVRATRGSHRDCPVLLCVLQDLTARVAVQSQQAQLREEAEAASRAKSRFLAAMSHEIRTPLHGILGHLELFAQSGLNESQRVRLRRMSQAAQSLLQIINDVLDLARIESGQLEIDVGVVGFAPDALLERVALLYAPLAQAKGVDLDYSVDPALQGRYRGALPRIEQVLRNLVSNAVKFTSSGRIELHIQPGMEANRLHFEVTDSGTGMNPMQVHRLFQPFVQADASIAGRYGGSGLGLSLCRELCRLMGGDISVHSTPGVGSRFAFEVEVTPARDTGGDAWRPLAGRRVLLRSAVVPWRNELARRLRAWGAEPVLLGSEDAVELQQALAAGGAPLVVFERNQPVRHEPALALCDRVIRVRADAPLQGVQRDGDWWVSCYSAHALLDALLATDIAPAGRASGVAGQHAVR